MFFLTSTEIIPDSFIGGLLYILRNYFPMYLDGMKYTLLIALTSTILGLIIAVFIVPIKIQQITGRDTLIQKILKKTGVILATIYVEVLRGTPMIVQSVIIFYGLAGLGYNLNIIICGILIVSINTSAYIIEVLRGSISSIDKGQLEAARSLGMTRSKAMIHIIIPQAIKNSIPAIGNEFVVNIKDTAVLMVISVTELYFITTKVNSIYYRQLEGFVISAGLYLLMTFTTTRILYLVSGYISGSKTKLSYPTSQTL
ncbi:amino acid ABC transporter permease [Mycoplasmatota bacterium]|nr:amino acid ABC transporter permease [Mycoplasmatota bacterium]